VLYDLGLGAPLGPHLRRELDIFSDDFPASVISRARGQLVSVDLNQAFAVGVGYPVSRWQHFEMVHGLHVTVMLVVVNLAEDLVLDDFVLVRLDDFVCHGYIRVRRRKSYAAEANVPGANVTS
jgi:hypothetical protein